VSERGCPGHANLAEELRDYAEGALDLLEPLVDRVRDQEPDESAPEPVVCASCPVCALITVMRGGRSELAVRLAEHAAGLLAVLRAALEEGIGAPPPGSRPPSAGAPTPPPSPSPPSAPPSAPPFPSPPFPSPPPSPASPSPASPSPASAPASPSPSAPASAESAPPPGPPPAAAPPHGPAQPSHSPGLPHHAARYRAARGVGRGGRLVQHIEISRDGRSRQSPEHSAEPC